MFLTSEFLSSWANICHFQIAWALYLGRVCFPKGYRVEDGEELGQHIVPLALPCCYSSLQREARKTEFQSVLLLHRMVRVRREKWDNSSSPPGLITVFQSTRPLSWLSYGESKPATLLTQARWWCTAGEDAESVFLAVRRLVGKQNANATPHRIFSFQFLDTLG